MNKAEAEELVQCLLGLGEPLNSATLMSSTTQPEVSSIEFRHDF